MAESWTFLSNHGHVLVALAKDPTLRLRDIAAIVGITERAVQTIVGDLEAAGYLERQRVGRRNAYVLRVNGPLRHPVESDHQVADLLAVFRAPEDEPNALTAPTAAR
jgi:predicted ArsR family transcriptional regulator